MLIYRPCELACLGLAPRLASAAALLRNRDWLPLGHIWVERPRALDLARPTRAAWGNADGPSFTRRAFPGAFCGVAFLFNIMLVFRWRNKDETRHAAEGKTGAADLAGA